MSLAWLSRGTPLTSSALVRPTLACALKRAKLADAHAALMKTYIVLMQDAAGRTPEQNNEGAVGWRVGVAAHQAMKKTKTRLSPLSVPLQPDLA